MDDTRDTGWTHYGKYLDRCARWGDLPGEEELLSKTDFASFQRLGGLETLSKTAQGIVSLAIMSGNKLILTSVCEFIAEVGFAAGLLAADEQREGE